jgi:hypothetical protein
MKKLLLILITILVSLSIKAQEINLGLSASLPLGDANDFYTFGLILDGEYLYDVSEQIKIGGSTGYIHSFGKEFDLNLNLQDPSDTPFSTNASYDDSGFIPISASGRFLANEKITIGLDLGYAFQVLADFPEKGGLYYAIKSQYEFSENLHVLAAYRSIIINDTFDFNFGFVSIGFMIGI